MDRVLMQRLDSLASVLFFMAVVVLLLALIGAIAVAASRETLGGFEELERQGRGLATVAVLVFGVSGSGLLAGVGGILKALVARDLAQRHEEPNDDD
jgi:hypothetical protein